MAQNPNRLEENVKQLLRKKGTLVLLRDEVARRGEQGKQGWLRNLEDKINEIDELKEKAAGLKNSSNLTTARSTLNNKVIQVINDVNVLKARGNANPEAVETLINEVAIDISPKKYSSADLSHFTSEYTTELGSGAFGKIYEGRLQNGVKVAVKVLFEKNITEELFTSEVDTAGKISHRNLIKLHGFCFEKDGKKALVYEYMKNGSLDKIIEGKGLGLDWDKLYAIAIETGKGLAYLHDGCDLKIIHHDVKPSNILLDSKFSPKITDFALAKHMNRDVSHRTNNSKMRGSLGYAAPEIWIPSSRITTKCDVYSFGILLFDILMIGFEDHSRKWFPKQVWEMFCVGQLDEIIKECGITEKSQKKARTLSLVALWCVQYTPETRPPMNTVVMMLQNEIPVTRPPNPFLPSLAPESSLSSLPPSGERLPKSVIDLNLERVVKKDTASQGQESSNASDSKSILESFRKQCPTGGENSVILYTIKRPGLKYYEDCNLVLSILRSHHVEVDERDYYSSGETMMELAELIGRIVLPALFVKGRFIGGADEVKKMEADGTLSVLFYENN